MVGTRGVEYSRSPSVDRPLNDLEPFGLGEFREQRTETFGHGATLPVGNGSAIHFRNGCEFAHRSSAEHFVGSVNLCQSDVCHFVGNLIVMTELQHSVARDAFRASVCERRFDDAIFNGENMCGVGLGDAALQIKHECIVNASSIRFQLGENGSELVARVNVLVEHVSGWATERGSDQRDTCLVVDGCFVLSEDDEGAAELIDAWVQAAGVLEASRQREADVNVIPHVVGFERAAKFIDELLVAGHAFELKGGRTSLESIQVCFEFEDAAVVNPQAFPHCVAVLHRRVERADASFVSVDEVAVDVGEDICVGFVECLEHDVISDWRFQIWVLGDCPLIENRRMLW